MTDTRLANGCEQCTEFDCKTRELMEAVLSQDERNLITLLLATAVRTGRDAMSHPKTTAKEKLAFSWQIDFAAAVLGKVIMSFPQATRDELESRILKDFQIKLNLRHEECPHQGKAVEE